MGDMMSEVLTSMKNNKMRIALTGFSIGWGLFILIVLIGTGNGLLNGMTTNFSSSSENVVKLVPSVTSMPFAGSQKGRTVKLYADDVAELQKYWGDTLRRIIPVINHPVQARRNEYYTNTSVDGYLPDYAVAPNIKITEGRDLNSQDMEEQRKVCVIPARLRNILFPDAKSSVIGSYITFDQISFEIVGVYEPVVKANTTRVIIAPFTTIKTLYQPDGSLTSLYLQTNYLTTAELNEQFNERLQHQLAAMKGYSPADVKAVKLTNAYEMPVLINGILAGLNIFVIVIGLATLIAGIVGISNIMLITVKERTRELGVRRAMGASNLQIMALVLIEAVIITVIFGYVGMFMGIGLTQLASWAIQSAGDNGIFANPTVKFSYVLAINGIMVLAGLIAGYVPAKRAVDIKLVEALTA